MTDDTTGMSAVLRPSSKRLTLEYDVALLDLDGVVYVGPDAVPAAPHALEGARADGMRLTFVTNNAARTPQAVATHLTELGIAADPAEVVTSAQVAAHYLADRLPAGSPVLVVGTEGLIVALRERGLTPVHSASDSPVAVVQGYSPNVDWAMLAEGAIAIRAGALWVATNLDATVPSPRGPLPGNGSMVAALIHATDRTPISTGKPDPTMHRETVERSQAKRPLVVGDRLDTDIEGAHAVGCDSILVLSGVTAAKDLIQAPLNHRATYLGRDLGALLYAHPAVAPAQDGASCGPWVARRRSGDITLSSGEASAAGTEDGLDALRALCGAAWAAEAPTGSWTVQAGDDRAKAELLALGL
jgi:glycerol 3-phosphatase-2